MPRRTGGSSSRAHRMRQSSRGPSRGTPGRRRPAPCFAPGAGRDAQGRHRPPITPACTAGTQRERGTPRQHHKASLAPLHTPRTQNKGLSPRRESGVLPARSSEAGSLAPAAPSYRVNWPTQELRWGPSARLHTGPMASAVLGGGQRHDLHFIALLPPADAPPIPSATLHQGNSQ